MTKAANLSALGTNTSSSGVLEILSGGTGQTTATAAFDALSPMTTVGDIIYEATGPTATRLGIGTSGQVLTVSGGIPSWQTPSSGGGYAVSVIGTNTLAVKSTLYVLTASLTLTLPASPTAGDQIAISNLSGTITAVVARNGEKIMNLNEDMTIDVISAGITLVYTGATYGWVTI